MRCLRQQRTLFGSRTLKRLCTSYSLMVFHLPWGRSSLIICNKRALILCQGVIYVEKKTCVECWYQLNLILLKRQLWNPVHIIYHNRCTWWCHQMEAFSALLALCVGNSDSDSDRLRVGGWWFETPSRPLWRHWNDMHLWQSGLEHSQPVSSFRA